MPSMIALVTCLSCLAAPLQPVDSTAVCCAGAEATCTDTATDSAAALERIKALAGEWALVGEDGKPTGELLSKVRVTAGGSAVMETLFPGTEKEMITLYHLDGDDLVLTHYCMLGNQPHMNATTISADKIVFLCDCTGVASPDESHMHQGTMQFVGNDHIRTEWLLHEKGEVVHTASFEAVRR